MTEAGSPARPLPVPDELSAPYWEAARRHRSSVARCARCQRLVVAPGLTCPECGTTAPAFAFVEVSGRGVVRSWAVVRQAFLPGLAVPFVLVDVELPEQADLRVVARLVDGPDAELATGDAVRAVFDDVTPEISIPAVALDRDEAER